jgi:hypothetical protein
VEILWTNGRKTVDDGDTKINVAPFPLSCRRSVNRVGRFRTALRLIRSLHDIQSSFLKVTVHHYEEHIAGRTYQIEVSPISGSRWRAQIARLPGMPTSMMPFYGTTPEEAAHELSKWLSLISGVAPVET